MESIELKRTRSLQGPNSKLPVRQVQVVSKSTYSSNIGPLKDNFKNGKEQGLPDVKKQPVSNSLTVFKQLLGTVSVSLS